MIRVSLGYNTSQIRTEPFWIVFAGHYRRLVEYTPEWNIGLMLLQGPNSDLDDVC